VSQQLANREIARRVRDALALIAATCYVAERRRATAPGAGQFVEELDQALRVCQEEYKKWWQFWR